MEVFNRFIAPKGFKFAGISSGIKKAGKDLAVIFSEQPCRSAGFYTTNVMAAAPVKVSKEHQETALPEAIIVNSGNANAATDKEGLINTYKMANLTASELGIDEKAVLVASTGVIGEPLPMKKVEAGIKKAVKQLSFNNGPDAAKAILTTDTVSKQISVQFELDGQLITVSGFAKGSGMIAPEMKLNHATMLAFIFTDAKISRKALYKILEDINERTFNSITVDGDTSTNDSVYVLANSIAGNHKIGPNDKSLPVIAEAFEKVFSTLARMIVIDGEGATKLIEINVNGANSEDEAKIIAKSIANSSLVKTAFFGQDANWGRILAAAGYSGVDFDPSKVKLSFNELEIVKNGVAVKVDNRKLKTIMSKYNIAVDLDLRQGKSSWKILTTDLSYDYIKINADYRS